MKWNLTKKGLILVSVPLIFELGFLTISFLQLSKTQNQLDEATRSMILVNQVTSIARTFYDAGTALGGYIDTKDAVSGENFSNLMKQLSKQIDELDQIPTSSDKERQAVQQLRHSISVAVNYMNTKRSQADDVPEELAHLEASSANKRIRNIADELQENIKAISQGKNESYKNVAQMQRDSQKQLIEGLLIGVTLNVLLTIALSIFLAQNIVKRLKVMHLNSELLASGKTLKDKVGGTDEIEALDRAFHLMSAALKESSRKERAIVDNAQDIICSLEPSGKFIELNSAVRRNLGFEPNELVGSRCITLISKEDAERTLQTLTNGCSGESTTFTLENQMIHKDGRKLDTGWSCTWSEEDKTIFCTIHDVTQRKRLEKLKREFVAMVSHDLRTPLTSFQCFLEGFADGMYDTSLDAAKKRARNSEADIGRLISLVSSLLDMEKMESGKMKIEVSLFPVQNLLSRSIESVRGFAEQNKVNLTFDAADVFLNADEDQLVQVIVNLIGNAIKFSPKLSTVQVQALELENDIEFRITDQGRGIPAAFVDKVFDRFEQVESSDAKVKGGTGLGLAICKAIVQAHNGTIGVNSIEGSGSTFWFRIPRDLKVDIE